MFTKDFHSSYFFIYGVEEVRFQSNSVAHVTAKCHESDDNILLYCLNHTQ